MTRRGVGLRISEVSAKSAPTSIRRMKSAGAAEWFRTVSCSVKLSSMERCRITDTSAST